jgi:ABC-type phosphate transport system ATPase subunit
MEPQRAQELADAIARQKGGCDEVWLTTLGYYPSLDYHKTLAERWVEPARIFRKAGVRVALQVANTLGHRDWDSLRPEKNSFLMKGMCVDGKHVDVLRGPDGKECWSCFCWRGERFRSYINGLVKIYCEKIQPYCLWLDDDLRPFAHLTVRYGCFCDNCMQRFNEQYGTSYTREELTSMFGIAFQNDFLFADTILENIKFGRDISDEDVIAAAKTAQAHQFISEISDGYSHMLSPGGTNLSGGQKQRLLISRALAARPPILILDDSSSALDYKTDAMLREALRRDFADTTVITVAQRVSSVMSSDLILVLEDGDVIGAGTHDELLASCPEYKEISDSQMGGAFVE